MGGGKVWEGGGGKVGGGWEGNRRIAVNRWKSNR